MPNNIEKSTLTALLRGKLAFKVFNEEKSEWETIRIVVPELETHAGAIATATEFGHVKLITDFESDSEEAAATAKSLSVTFKAINSHVNEEGIHLDGSKNTLINKIPEILERLEALEEK